MKSLVCLMVLQFSIVSANSTQAQWRLTNGPYGGNLNPIKIIGDTIIVGTYSGTFISTNGGSSWILPANSLVGYIESLAIKGSNIFAGLSGDGIYISTDTGYNWLQINNGLTNKIVRSIAISENNIFAGTRDGVFLSSDNGNNWIQTTLTNHDVQVLKVNGNNIYAGTYQDGMFLSSDNGTSWTQINNGISNSSVWTIATNDSNIFIGTD
jgi:hypothetical protein